MKVFTPAMAIIRREFLSQLRQRSTYRNLIFVLLPLMALLCFLMYLSNTSAEYRTRLPLAQYFFQAYIILLYFACLLTATTLGALGICTEREQDTYDLLCTTHITPGAIILGKLVGALGICFLTVIAALPLMGLQFFFTGVEVGPFVLALAIIFVTSLSAAMIGLAASARSRRTLAAMARAYAIVFMVNGGGLLLLVLATSQVSYMPALVPAFEIVIFTFCPPIALSQTVWAYNSTVLLGLAGFHGICFLVEWHVCVTRLDARDDVRTSHVDDTPGQTGTSANRTSPGITHWLAPPWPLPDGRNPVYFKELLESVLALRRNTVKIFVIVCGVCLAGSFAALNGVRTGFHNGEETVFYLSTGLFLLLAPALIAPAVAREFTYGNMDALRTTLLGPADILRGKLAAAARNLAVVFAAIALGGLPLFLDRLHERGIWAFAISTTVALLVSACYALCLSLLVSCTARNARQGLLHAYAACILALWLVPYAITNVYTVVWLPPSNNWATHLVCLSPYLAQMLNFDTNRDGMLNLHWLFNVFVFLVISFVLYRIAIYRFRRVYIGAKPHMPGVVSDALPPSMAPPSETPNVSDTPLVKTPHD